MIPADPTLLASSPLPPTAPADAPAPARVLIEGQLAVLSRLTQIGMEIAEAAGQEARAAAATAASAPEEGAAPAREHRRDPGLVFARVARAVRMTIALQSRLLKDLADLDRAEERAASDRTRERRRRLSRLLDEAARASVTARRDAGAQHWADEDAVEEEIEAWSAHAYERLTDAEDGDLWGRSFDEVVAGVVKDLGLSPDWCAPLLAATVPPPGPTGGAGEAPQDALGTPRPMPPPAPPPRTGSSPHWIPESLLAEGRAVLAGATGPPQAPP